MPVRILTPMATSTHLPLCIYCGTARPADETRCPHCGRPWIDVRVGSSGEEAAPVAAAAAAEAAAAVPPPPPPPDAETAESDTTEDEPDGTDDTGTGNNRSMWLIPALIVAVAVAVFALFQFGVLDGGTGTVAAPAPTTAAPTVVPSTTPSASTSSTAAPTTTSSTVPPTTIPGPGDIAPIGEPIPLPSLTLRSGGLGPIDFGAPAADAMGRLVSSIGEPSETGAANEDLGLCAGDDGRFVRWDGLTAILSGTLADGTFVGYRYDEVTTPTMQLDLATPSGLRIGDTITRLNDIYAPYQIDYLSTEGTDVFRLSDDTGLLLWGPVSSPEPTGLVEGIYAPNPCPDQP